MNFSRWPHYSDKDISDVAAILASGRVNQWTGEHVHLFEQEYAQWIGHSYAVALSNGTVALEIALKSLGVGPGDEVIVTSRSFIASASAIASVGARAVFCDVDACSGNVSAQTFLPHITDRTKVLLAVHIGGLPCDMGPIMELAGHHKLKVIEDCAQAHGASLQGRKVGTFGDLACWSFCQDKIITTAGEGGMVSTNNEDLYRFIRSYKDHGKNFEKIAGTSGFGFRFVHDVLGTNARMTEIQAVIGRNQLRRVDDWVSIRNRNASILSQYVADLPIWKQPTITPSGDDPAHLNAFYKYYLFLLPEFLDQVLSRDELAAEIVAAGVPCFSGSCAEIYREKAFDQSEGKQQLCFRSAALLSRSTLMFTVHPTLSEDEMHRMGESLRRTVKRYG